MSDSIKPSKLERLRARFKPMARSFSEELTIAALRSVPLVGPALALDRKTFRRLKTLFDDDDDIQKDLDKVVSNIAETEEIMVRVKTHLQTRKTELQDTLNEYNRFKELAAVEKEKAQPILNELRREGKKGLFWGIAINLIMILLGILLAHFLRKWFPAFIF